MNNSERLLKHAKDAAAVAYAPYSGFRVGAAVRAADGEVYRGANVENASYGVTICAEQAAAAAAVSAGRREFSAIAVASPDGHPVWPCGSCLQVLSEFGPNLLVIAESESGRPVTKTIEDLLPTPFGLPKE